MSEQVQRILYILKRLQEGHRLTTKELMDEMPPEFSGMSLRTVQRDMVLIQECIQGIICTKQGHELLWEFDKGFRRKANISSLNSGELISFYILKAHLKTFENTVIEQDVKKLSKKLEAIAPNDLYSIESLYWDQNIGQYDYSGKDMIIRRVLHFMAEKKWVDVEYYSINKEEVRTFTLYFQKIFTYYGMLYIAAFLPEHNKHIAISVHNIESIEENKKLNKRVPEFNFEDWSKHRFGVFEGEPKKVELLIPKKYSSYFSNRHWHQSQNESFDEEGNMILTMFVPLTPDFMSWLFSWIDLIVVIKPDELIQEVKKKLIDSLSNYINL